MILELKTEIAIGNKNMMNKKFILDFDKNSTRTLTYHYEVKTNNGRYISLGQSIEWAIPGIERILYQNYNINYDITDNRLVKI